MKLKFETSAFTVNAQLGFTLVELFITISILGILISYAIPGMGRLITEARYDSSVDKFRSSIDYARSTALTQNVQVVMCPTNNPNAVLPSCVASGINFHNGWMVYRDCDGDSKFEGVADVCDDDLDSVADSPENILKVHSPLATNNVTIVSDSAGLLVFDSIGQAISTLNFNMSSDHETNTLTVNTMGRIVITEHTE